MFQALRFGSKADMCSAPAHVCYGPKADMRLFDEYIDTPQYVPGIVRPMALAVLRLMANSNFVGCSIGISFGCFPVLHKLGRKIGSHRLFSWATAVNISAACWSVEMKMMAAA
jgi:hypothetical protein